MFKKCTPLCLLLAVSLFGHRLTHSTEEFSVGQSKCFVLDANSTAKEKPWVWYAPTLPRHPDPSHAWLRVDRQTLTDMNLVGQEKNDVQVYSVGLLEEAYMEKFYENIDKGMTKEEAARDALYGETGVLTDVNNNQSESQYIKSPFAPTETAKFKPDEIEQAHILVGKKELNAGLDWRSNHIGGAHSKKHLDTIEKNIAKYGLWRGLDESKEAVSYYQRLTRGKHFDGGGDYIKFIDSQLRLNSPGHPGFFGAEIDINNYNHKLALNKALFDYESGLIDDKFGFSEVWNDSLRTLEFNDIDHWLHASGNIKDSFDIDSGFWSEADNISFITDYDLEFGEIN